jgi:hypothetical protein
MVLFIIILNKIIVFNLWFSWSSISFFVSFLKVGDIMAVVATISKVILPQKTTAVTVPISLAVKPLSKAPSSLDEPTNISLQKPLGHAYDLGF